MSSTELKTDRIESDSTASGVLYTVDDGLAWVELNRPMAANSMNSSTVSELQEIWASLRTDPTVKAVILIGTGTEAFTVGLDSRAATEHARSGHVLGPRGFGVHQHFIVALNGIARKEAQDFLRDADVVVAAEHITLDIDRYVRNGTDVTSPADGAPTEKLAVSTTRARESGLVDIVVPLHELRQTAADVARRRIAGSRT